MLCEGWLGRHRDVASVYDVVRSAPQEVRQYHVKDRHGADAALLYGQEPGDMAEINSLDRDGRRGPNPDTFDYVPD